MLVIRSAVEVFPFPGGPYSRIALPEFNAGPTCSTIVSSKVRSLRPLRNRSTVISSLVTEIVDQILGPPRAQRQRFTSLVDPFGLSRKLTTTILTDAPDRCRLC